MEIKKMKMNLQHFAEPEGDTETQESDETQDTNDADEVLKLTPEELQRKIDSEADRRLDKVLKKKQQEWESELQQRIDEAVKEQQRLSKLSEKERKEEELTRKEKLLAEKEAELVRKELRSETIEVLQEKELPATFADFLLAEDAESTLENINNFKKAFDAAVNAAVKEKLRQDTPKAGTGTLRNGKAPSVAELAKEARVIK